MVGVFLSFLVGPWVPMEIHANGVTPVDPDTFKMGVGPARKITHSLIACGKGSEFSE